MFPAMVFDRQHLIAKAMRALMEVADASSDAPLAPALSVRFTLAFLYAIGDGNREPFDRFWREIRATHDSAYSSTAARYLRATSSRTALNEIGRSVGYPETPEAWKRG